MLMSVVNAFGLAIPALLTSFLSASPGVYATALKLKIFSLF
jgi:hypothetical protein